jgi:hypothetical protein
VSPCKYLRCCEFHLGSWHGRTVSATSRRPPPLPLAAKTALRMLLLGPARLLCITSKRHQRSSSSSSRACSRSCSSRCPTTSTTTAKGRWPPQPEPNHYYSKTVNNHRFLLSQLTMMVMTLLFSLSLSLFCSWCRLIGKVAADHSHKWVFKEPPEQQETNLISSWTNPADSVSVSLTTVLVTVIIAAHC